MVAKTRAKSKSRPAPEPEEIDEEKDYSLYLEKAPTALHERFADWILEKTGYEPTDEEEFRTAVSLSTALRMEHQRSPENQEVLAENRAKAAAAKEERESAPAKPRGRPKKRAAVEEPEDIEEDVEEDEEEAPAPKRRPARAKAGATTKTAAKTGATRARRARPAAKKATKEEAPF